MARSGGSFRYHLRSFFTNWREYEGPFGTKVRLTLRNRIRALTRGCCGHPGEPGC
jgi:hypothetical protein